MGNITSKKDTWKEKMTLREFLSLNEKSVNRVPSERKFAKASNV